ncbi:MAG: hypothetical protein D6714_02935 [Bacteroidetes bacterium]|nr:MAG: hypothetical protein D6714_02935 [Bacteroidota bacterium]
MRSLKILLSTLFTVAFLATTSFAHVNPDKKGKVKNEDQQVNFREQCTTPSAQIDQDVNNVRARLTTGGDCWWDRSDGRYIVPKVEPGETEVSSIFAGGVWLGGVDPGGNLKVAAQTYGQASGSSDFWAGPIHPETGVTDKAVCDDWDRFFEVSRQEIDEHLALFEAAKRGEITYTADMIPFGVKGWPAKGNQNFFDVWEFELPNTPQALAGFWDEDGDGLYDPLMGDYPIIEIRGCDEPNVPDEMIFWIYNDQGGGSPHGETSGQAIKMEVQVQTFAFETNDEINDMTFQRFKLINRADENIEQMYFAMWVDPDLGCHLDDYIGCDTARSLAIIYNADAVDGQPGTDCAGGVPTYGFEVPVLGIDYFRGPLNEFRQELGMTSFTYFNNNINNPPPGTTDPNTAQEFYNYLRGLWRDGTPFTFGGDGYNPGSTDTIAFAFPSPPALTGNDHWSMCTESLPEYDRRTVQASGPFLLQPGAVNELIIGVVWQPDFAYPCPDISRLVFADDISQSLFDNCFDITDGPDAPDVDWVELDRELIAVLTNDTIGTVSNNAREQYNELDLQAPEFINIDGVDVPLDSPANHYFFEGYKLYQLIGPDVGIADLEDPEKARLIYQVDVENGVSEIINWTPEAVDEIGTSVWIPKSMVQGADDGIRHTFRITEDQFGSGNERRLINHKKYYFTAIAYAYNKYLQFDPFEVKGQRTPYLEGRRNIKTYVAIPRPITDRGLNAEYGDGAVITRIDGVGLGGNFLDMSDQTKEEILEGTFDGDILYNPGAGPVNVTIYNPLEVKDGNFEITFVDSDMTDDVLEPNARWKLTELNGSGNSILSETTIERLNEQILAQYGFTITLGQTMDVGEKGKGDNGVIGYDGTYSDLNKPFWFAAIPDDFPILFGGSSVYNYVATGVGEPDNIYDQDQALSTIGGNGFFVPYQLCDYRDKPTGTTPFYITPAWRANGSIVRDVNDLLPELNNVDIVFTSDKSKWSRCVIVETKSPYYDNFGFSEQNTAVRTEGDAKQFDVRQSPAVSKEDADGDGLPDVDPNDSRMGMGWFPGYAIDVETGKRLNIFFGENSAYAPENGFMSSYTSPPTGRDMMFNPTNQVILNTDNFANIMTLYSGGQHFIYVTNEEYDECAFLHERFSASSSLKKVKALKDITWTSLPVLPPDVRMTSYAEGLIPNDFTVKLRVDNPYAVAIGTGDFNGYPTYRFTIEGAQASPLDEVGIAEALQQINVVPNPYYGFSDYEGGRTETVVKITNLPAKCKITIYSLDGKFIREYNRDEAPQVPTGNNRGVPFAQIIPDVEWDLKNNKGIPVAAGTYLIHIDAPGLGERTLKWFGMPRQFDPSAL